MIWANSKGKRLTVYVNFYSRRSPWRNSRKPVWQYMLISTLVDPASDDEFGARLTVYVNFYSRRFQKLLDKDLVWQYMLISTLVD